jgi:hypothetical protein
MIRVSIALGCALVASASGAELQAGYELHGNVAGLSHGIAGEAVFEYVETGFVVAYGSKPIYEQETRPAGAAGFQSQLVLHRATVFKVDAPVRTRYKKWPYLFGQLGYERILDVEGVDETLATGFAKGNEFTLYYGAGYALWFNSIGVRLELGTRSILTDPDKTAFYRDAGADPAAKVLFDTDRFGSKVVWQAGLRYRFHAPGG